MFMASKDYLHICLINLLRETMGFIKYDFGQTKKLDFKIIYFWSNIAIDLLKLF